MIVVSHRRAPGARALLAAAVVALAPAVARAQRVKLELRPAPGDTLHMRVDQEMEITGTSTRPDGAEATRTMTTTLHLLSRAVVEARQGSATSIYTITDSVRLWSSDQHAKAMTEATERALRGRRVHLLVAADGSARVLDGEMEASGARAVPDLMAAMPAAFPARPIAVHDHWSRELALPAGGPGMLAGGGIFRASFRLDSLSRAGTLAYISMRGEIDRDDAESASGSGAAMRGTLAGALVLDRARGWLAESRVTMTVHSTVSAGAAGTPPMHFTTRVTQRMRTAGKR